MYGLGARRIGVFSAPPIGCVPSQRTLGGGITRGCAEEYNSAAKLFNSKLSRSLNSLTTSLPNSKLVYVDVYNPLLDIILNPAKNGNPFLLYITALIMNLNLVAGLIILIIIAGFKVVEKGCCGTGNIEVAVLCNKFDTTCENPSDHVFWDSYHPTERTYSVLIPPLLQKYVNDFF